MHASKPFFCWMNTTRMHLRTHVRADHRDKPGLTSRTEYADGMIEHDNVVGTILKAVDDLGIAKDPENRFYPSGIWRQWVSRG
jgi:arylsulfatase A-like enzyme